MEARTVLQPASASGRAGWTSADAARPALASILLVIGLTLVGLALRLATSGRALFADELSTSWIVQTHGLGGVLSTVHSNAEITPPLYFVLAWASTKLGHGAQFLRLPSIVAGTVTIPVVYALGLRTVGRMAALVAAALTAVAPFMVYYGTEARSYGVMMALVVLSTLALLCAVDTGRFWWWALYAACSCGAAYAHYTCVFVLLVQLAWVLWAHPEARKGAILANAAAVVAFLPWASGLHNDLTSPTSKILSALSPFDLHSIWVAFGHWTVGYPYSILPLTHVPGVPALIAIGVGLAMAVVGVLVSRGVLEIPRTPDRRLLLLVGLALATPVGEGLVSLVSTNLFGVRNLAASWPALALVFSAVLVAPRPAFRIAAVALAVGGFVVGAIQMLAGDHMRPDYAAAGRYVDAHAGPKDVVLDSTAELSPGPFSPFDVTVKKPHPIVRAQAPAERDHPFAVQDPITSWQQAIDRAVALAHGHRIYEVMFDVAAENAREGRFPARYRRVAQTTWPSFLGPVAVRVYAAR